MARKKLRKFAITKTNLLFIGLFKQKLFVVIIKTY